MKNISLLVPEGQSSLVNIEGTYQIFSEVNNLLVEMGREPAFDLHLVGLSRESRQTSGHATLYPDQLMQEVKKTDLIIIPAVFGNHEEVLTRNNPFISWILRQYKEGAEIVSFCIGAFFLAETGLLNGKRCATHWRFANEFRRRYPEVHLMDDKIMTEDSGIFTSGGAYSALNLQIYLVEKYVGREIAVLASKLFMIDIDRSQQSPFIIFQGQKAHDDDPVKKAQVFIESHYQSKITVDELASRFAFGRRNLERRFKKATSNTVLEYMQRVRIEAAKKTLETSRKTVNEVMYEVGYSDTKAFRTVFKKITGLSPIDYRNKYNKEATAVKP